MGKERVLRRPLPRLLSYKAMLYPHLLNSLQDRGEGEEGEVGEVKTLPAISRI